MGKREDFIVFLFPLHILSLHPKIYKEHFVQKIQTALRYARYFFFALK